MLIRSKVDVVVILCVNPDFGLSSKSLGRCFSRLTLSPHFWITFSPIEFVVFLLICFLFFGAMVSFRLFIENLHDPFHMLVKFCLSRPTAAVIFFVLCWTWMRCPGSLRYRSVDCCVDFCCRCGCRIDLSLCSVFLSQYIVELPSAICCEMAFLATRITQFSFFFLIVSFLSLLVS